MPDKNSREFWFKQWMKHVGPICRLVDKIARDLGEKGGESSTAVQNHLKSATQEMQEWMEVKK